LVPGIPVRRTAVKPEFCVEQVKTLGEQIRRTRNMRGLTLAQAAEVIGVQRWTLGLWERGAQEPRASLLPAIARFLG
jgi:transcriptional regulator with XRE-family HTH domain